MRKVLIYSHDTFGLGNIKRMLEVARQLVDSHPDTSVLILTGSPMLHAFRIPPRIDYVKLPSLARTADGQYIVKFLSIHYQDTVRLRANLILSTVIDFQPDLIIVDKKPFGVGNEFAPALDVLQRRSNRPKLVLLLRDILDSPAATRAVWNKNGYFAAIESHYDQVLVVGSPEIFDVRVEYSFPPAAAAKVRFCGYIGRERGRVGREATRRSLALTDAPTVLVSAGGGEDGYDLLSTYLEGLMFDDGRTRFESVILCGPEMPATLRARLHARARQLPHARVLDFSDDMMSLVEAADLTVSMGGYNTICELLTLKKRAIVVPRTRPVQEQWIRADRMSRLGLLRALHPDHLTPKTLMSLVGEELAQRNVLRQALHQIDLDGLTGMTRWLDALGEAAEPSAQPYYPAVPALAQ